MKLGPRPSIRGGEKTSQDQRWRPGYFLSQLAGVGAASSSGLTDEEKGYLTPEEIATLPLSEAKVLAAERARRKVEADQRGTTSSEGLRGALSPGERAIMV